MTEPNDKSQPTLTDRIRSLTRGQFVLLMIVGVGGTIFLGTRIVSAGSAVQYARLWHGANSAEMRTALSDEATYKLGTLGVAVATFAVAWVRLGKRG